MRNVVGLLLLVFGVTGLLVASWVCHPLLGLAATSLGVGAVGLWLATTEA